MRPLQKVSEIFVCGHDTKHGYKAGLQHETLAHDAPLTLGPARDSRQIRSTRRDLAGKPMPPFDVWRRALKRAGRRPTLHLTCRPAPASETTQPNTATARAGKGLSADGPTAIDTSLDRRARLNRG